MAHKILDTIVLVVSLSHIQKSMIKRHMYTFVRIFASWFTLHKKYDIPSSCNPIVFVCIPSRAIPALAIVESLHLFKSSSKKLYGSIQMYILHAQELAFSHLQQGHVKNVACVYGRVQAQHQTSTSRLRCQHAEQVTSVFMLKVISPISKLTNCDMSSLIHHP